MSRNRKSPPRAGAREQAAIFRQALLLAFLAALAAAVLPLRAQEPGPEIQRPPGSPQAVGAVHTVRQIPEACVRLEGSYAQAGAAAPYALQVVPLGGACQPRARYVGAEQAQPSAAAGWTLNDVVKIPEAACPGREAVVQVWRKSGADAPARDGQGQARIYLEQGREQAAAGASRLPQYSAVLQAPQGACGN